MDIYFKPSVYKQLKKIPRKEQQKIMKKIELLAKDPLSGKILQGEMDNLRSLRAWPYRIIYYIEKTRIVVRSVAHRQGVYRN